MCEVRESCATYFKGFEEWRALSSEKSWTDWASTMIKIASYVTLVLPALVGIVWLGAVFVNCLSLACKGSEAKGAEPRSDAVPVPPAVGSSNGGSKGVKKQKLYGHAKIEQIFASETHKNKLVELWHQGELAILRVIRNIDGVAAPELAGTHRIIVPQAAIAGDLYGDLSRYNCRVCPPEFFAQLSVAPNNI